MLLNDWYFLRIARRERAGCAGARLRALPADTTPAVYARRRPDRLRRWRSPAALTITGRSHPWRRNPHETGYSGRHQRLGWCAGAVSREAVFRPDESPIPSILR